MEEIYNIESITELNRMLNQPTPKHPLVSVIDFSKIDSLGAETGKFTSDFYYIMFKNHCQGKLKYGREYYDFQEGTLVCVAPRQVITIEKEDNPKDSMMGWGLFFHPDLLRGTSLGIKMKDYTFFSYETNEALHLSEKEKQTLYEIILKIEQETSENIDQHSQTLIVSNIALLLNYCSRYYDRQFITRKSSNKDLLVKFENLLNAYFASDELKIKGIPSVNYCAHNLFLSPNYLSDLLKKETGLSAQDHIHHYIIEEAKTKMLSTNLSISEIAFELGFEYPQYFSKLFKSKTGKTPKEYRIHN